MLQSHRFERVFYRRQLASFNAQLDLQLDHDEEGMWQCCFDEHHAAECGRVGFNAAPAPDGHRATASRARAMKSTMTKEAVASTYG